MQELLLASQRSLFEYSSALPDVERAMLLDNHQKIAAGRVVCAWTRGMEVCALVIRSEETYQKKIARTHLWAKGLATTGSALPGGRKFKAKKILMFFAGLAMVRDTTNQKISDDSLINFALFSNFLCVL